MLRILEYNSGLMHSSFVLFPGSGKMNRNVHAANYPYFPLKKVETEWPYRAVWRSHGQSTTVELIPWSIPILCRFIDQLIECRIDIVGKLDFSDRSGSCVCKIQSANQAIDRARKSYYNNHSIKQLTKHSVREAFLDQPSNQSTKWMIKLPFLNWIIHDHDIPNSPLNYLPQRRQFQSPQCPAHIEAYWTHDPCRISPAGWWMCGKHPQMQRPRQRLPRSDHCP